MARGIASLFLTVVLAACGGDGDQGGAPAAAANVAFRPGRWQVANAIAGSIPQEEHLCVTAEQAQSGRFLAGDVPAGCDITRNVVAAGRIDLAIQCGQGERAMRNTVSGTYDADTYRVDSTFDLGGGQAIRATSTATFMGDECRAGDIGFERR